MKEIKVQVPWTKTLLDNFIEEGMLTEDEQFLMRTRCAGWSQIKQAEKLNISTSTVSNMVNKCKAKYDRLHEQFPERFPERRVSKVEEAMDEVENTPTDKSQLCRTCKYFNKNWKADELLNCMNNCEYTL